MNLEKFMENLAEEIGGKFSIYDSRTSVIVVPVPNHRVQNVRGIIYSTSKGTRVEFHSRVCKYEFGMDLKRLLEMNASLPTCRIIIQNDFVEVCTFGIVEEMDERQLKDMVLEVAQVADTCEFELTAADVY